MEGATPSIFLFSDADASLGSGAVEASIDDVDLVNVADIVAALFEARRLEEEIRVSLPELLPFEGAAQSAVVGSQGSVQIAIQLVAPGGHVVGAVGDAYVRAVEHAIVIID